MPRNRKGPADPGPILLPFVRPTPAPTLPPDPDLPQLRVMDVLWVHGDPCQLCVEVWEDDDGRPVEHHATLKSLTTGLDHPRATDEEFREMLDRCRRARGERAGLTVVG